MTVPTWQRVVIFALHAGCVKALFIDLFGKSVALLTADHALHHNRWAITDQMTMPVIISRSAQHAAGLRRPGACSVHFF